jgi:hypothetical protein
MKAEFSIGALPSPWIRRAPSKTVAFDCEAWPWRFQVQAEARSKHAKASR